MKSKGDECGPEFFSNMEEIMGCGRLMGMI